MLKAKSIIYPTIKTNKSKCLLVNSPKYPYYTAPTNYQSIFGRSKYKVHHHISKEDDLKKILKHILTQCPEGNQSKIQGIENGTHKTPFKTVSNPCHTGSYPLTHSIKGIQNAVQNTKQTKEKNIHPNIGFLGLSDITGNHTLLYQFNAPNSKYPPKCIKRTHPHRNSTKKENPFDRSDQ